MNGLTNDLDRGFQVPSGTEMKLAIPPRPTWRWWVFGRSFAYAVHLPKSSLWHRILTRIVLRSEWEKLS